MGKDKRQSPSTLLWFIRHKSYVPISEIRRRFLLDSDDGAFIEAGGNRRAYVGLPSGTAQSLEKLWKQGKIGLELSSEFDAHVLIGVYPMSPARESLNGMYNGHVNGHHHDGQNGHVQVPAFESVPEPDDVVLVDGEADGEKGIE